VSKRYIFHLSIPVADLAASKRFYVDVLGARIGRETEAWVDVLVWGHQITLQRAPDEAASNGRGKRHFGVVLPWTMWQSEAKRLEAIGKVLLETPKLLQKDSEDEHAKLYLSDPSGNVIEIKAYRNVGRTLGLEDD